MNEPDYLHQNFQDLCEDSLTHSRDIGEISAALSSALKDIKDIPKSAQAHNYKYAPLELYTPMVRQACINNELFLLQSPSSGPDRLGVVTLITHGSGQWIRGEVFIPFDPTKYTNLPQAAGAIFSYLRRYAIGGFFSISAHGNDYDAVEANIEPEKPKVKPASAKLLARLSKAADSGPEALKGAFASLTDKTKSSLTSAQVAQFKATARAVSDGN
jgi:hypothetical protein